MGRPADITARLCFIFPGCLKQAGAPSDGRRTAKEEVPLTGQREEPAPQGYPAKVGPRTEGGRGEGCVWTITLQWVPQGREVLVGMGDDWERPANGRLQLFYPGIKYLLEGESQHSLLQGLQAATLFFFLSFKNIYIFRAKKMSKWLRLTSPHPERLHTAAQQCRLHAAAFVQVKNICVTIWEVTGGTFAKWHWQQSGDSIITSCEGVIGIEIFFFSFWIYFFIFCWGVSHRSCPPFWGETLAQAFVWGWWYILSNHKHKDLQWPLTFNHSHMLWLHLLARL